MTKAELRKLYLEKRSTLSAAEVSDASRRIADRFFESVDLSGFGTLHCFISIPKFNEIDTSAIYDRVWRDFSGLATASPRTDLASGTIESVIFNAQTDWNENSWGIREPAGGDIVEPADIDLVVVPLLCFDWRLHRVGYGKGMYDKFLARCRKDCVKVGVSLFPPVDTIADTSESDVALDLVITSEAAFNTQAETRESRGGGHNSRVLKVKKTRVIWPSTGP
jgi:5-formyltetrahydrofolate cyclo-ligase